MSEHSKIASESMKQLTEKIVKADLASRKRKMMHFSSLRIVSLVWFPIVGYTFYVRDKNIIKLIFFFNFEIY